VDEGERRYDTSVLPVVEVVNLASLTLNEVDAVEAGAGAREWVAWHTHTRQVNIATCSASTL
jgi:hypothetical protein